jgi:hypothetical protein
MEDPIKKPFPHNILRDDNMAQNQEFTWWYERVYLQSPRMCALQYDDEKLWEAWKMAYRQGVVKGMELKEKDAK